MLCSVVFCSWVSIRSPPVAVHESERASWHPLCHLQLCGLNQARLWFWLSQLSFSVLWAECWLFWVNWWFIWKCSAMWEDSQSSNTKMKVSFSKESFARFYFWKPFFPSSDHKQKVRCVNLFYFPSLKIIVSSIISDEKSPCHGKKIEKELWMPLFQYFFPSQSLFPSVSLLLLSAFPKVGGRVSWILHLLFICFFLALNISPHLVVFASLQMFFSSFSEDISYLSWDISVSFCRWGFDKQSKKVGYVMISSSQKAFGLQWAESFRATFLRKLLFKICALPVSSTRPEPHKQCHMASSMGRRWTSSMEIEHHSGWACNHTPLSLGT